MLHPELIYVIDDWNRNIFPGFQTFIKLITGCIVFLDNHAKEGCIYMRTSEWWKPEVSTLIFSNTVQLIKPLLLLFLIIQVATLKSLDSDNFFFSY